jgi:hypothetical protein
MTLRHWALIASLAFAVTAALGAAYFMAHDAGDTSRLPVPALVYALDSPARTVVVYDIDQQREFRRIELPEHAEHVELVSDGRLVYVERDAKLFSRTPIQFGAPYTLIELNLRNGDVRQLLHVERFVSFGIAVSPDGSRLAYSSAVGEPPPGLVFPDIAVHVFDLRTGDDREIARFRHQSDEFSGSATARSWHADGDAMFIVGAKGTEAPSGRAFLHLDGSVVYNEHARSYVAPNSKWLVYSDAGLNSVSGVARKPQRIRLIDPESNREMNRMEDDDQCLSNTGEWSPDHSALVVVEYEPAAEQDGASRCDLTRRQVWLLRADGSPPERIHDLRALIARWRGDRFIEFVCPDGHVGYSETWCSPADVELRLNGRPIASGRYIRVLGWIERVP